MRNFYLKLNLLFIVGILFFSCAKNNTEPVGVEISSNSTSISSSSLDNVSSSSSSAFSSEDNVASNSSSSSSNSSQDNTSPDLQETGKLNWLYVEGSQLYDSRGNKVRLTGVNWFGFETNNKIVHGLWARDFKDILQDIVDMGFNTIRIPWSNAIIGETTPVDVNTYNMNQELIGKTPVEALVIICEEARKKGLKIILDNHSRAHDAYLEEDLWYTSEIPEEKWIEDWKYIASLFKNNDAVIGMDLNNEPHDRATWGTGDPATDWAMAAEKCGNAILEVNPNVLIIVEGVEGVNGEGSKNSYWWGGNLQGVAKRPIKLSNPKKLVYSAHEYGPTVYLQPWFEASDFPENLPAIWDKQFGYIAKEKISHIYIGEFGIKEAGGKDEIWFKSFLEYMSKDLYSYSWTFWALNPNSGDTGGIFDYDWKTVVQWKLDYLKPYLAPLIGNGNG